MERLLSDLCDEWEADGNCCTFKVKHCPARDVTCLGMPRQACLHCDHGVDLPYSCTRPDDASCKALAEYKDGEVDSCPSDCPQLIREDPSPPGVCLGSGYQLFCSVDEDPDLCPLKAWEDDVTKGVN